MPQTRPAVQSSFRLAAGAPADFLGFFVDSPATAC
jgi:hypothetical protein